jgi:hypothetical protein
MLAQTVIVSGGGRCSALTLSSRAWILDPDIPQWRSSVSRNTPPKTAEAPCTLSDADITSQRAVTRRSLLGALGVGAGVAAAAAFGASEDAFAADTEKKKKDTKAKKKPKKEESDAD